MAENKKSFLLYCDQRSVIDMLPDEIAGKLFKHIYAYVNDENPTSSDILINLAFEPIKLQLKRDLIKWEEITETKSINGKLGNLKRWNEDLHSKVIKNEISLDEAENIAKNRKTSHSDNPQSQPIANIAVNVNDNVNDNVKVNEIKSIVVTPQHPLQDYINKNFERVSKMKIQMTYENCETIIQENNKQAIIDTLEAMENYKDLSKRISVYLTLKKWLKNDFNKSKPSQSKLESMANNAMEALNILNNGQ